MSVKKYMGQKRERKRSEERRVITSCEESEKLVPNNWYAIARVKKIRLAAHAKKRLRKNPEVNQGAKAYELGLDQLICAHQKRYVWS